MLKNKSSVGIKIIAAFISIFLFTTLLLFILAINLVSFKNEQVRMLAIQTLVEADRDAYQSNLALSFILSPANFRSKEFITQELDNVTSNLEQVITRFNKFYALYQSTGAGEDFSYFNSLHNDLENKTLTLLKLINSNELELSTNYYFSTYQPSFTLLRDEIDKITELTLEKAERESKKVEFIANNIYLIITFVLFVLLIYLLIIGFVIIKSIIKPINNTINILNDSITLLASFSDRISTSSQQIANGATEQASQIEELSSSVEELTSTVRHNLSNAKETSELSEVSSKNANEGYDEMNKMFNSMTDINSSSNEIRKVIKVIDDIAFQTNILALNAAVEAARAGETGMGFAVVAEEVKNLANRSSSAAQNSTEMIENSINKAEQGLKVAGSLTTIFEKIMNGLIKVNEMAREVERASQEQTKGLEQVNKAIIEFDSVVQNNAALSEETAGSVTELNSLAEQISRQLGALTRLIKGEKK